MKYKVGDIVKITNGYAWHGKSCEIVSINEIYYLLKPINDWRQPCPLLLTDFEMDQEYLNQQLIKSWFNL